MLGAKSYSVEERHYYSLPMMKYDKGLDSKGVMVGKIFLAHSSAIKWIVMSGECNSEYSQDVMS